MALTSFDPVVVAPDDLVAPSRLDPAGKTGPTRGQARGRRWRRCAPGLYVPVSTAELVEQRILEQATRLPDDGAVTAWAALRWHGAGYFAGTTSTGERAPVTLVMSPGGEIAPSSEVVVSKAQLAPSEARAVRGLQVASVQRALFDEVVDRQEHLWSAVQAIDMTLAARLISLELFRTYVEHRSGWTGVPAVHKAVALASEHSRSPRETWLRLVWMLSAELPLPLCNQPVYDRWGELLGVPDLLDPVAGLVLEYNGEYHDDPTQRTRDATRETGFRDHGLEYAEFARGDAVGTAAHRMLQARARAKFLAPESRAWTVEHPEGRPAPESLDARMVRLGLVADRSTF